MKALLICPAERPALQALTTSMPLVLLPIFGKSLIEYWIEHAAALGVSQVRVLAADRPDQIRAKVGDGSRWGVGMEIIPISKELTVEEARVNYRALGKADWLPEPNDVILMDHLPGLPAMCDSYAGWFAALRVWMPRAVTPNRIGLRELEPGVWVGLRTRVSASATFHAPCWLGESVSIGPGAVIGPGAILEDKAVIEAAAEISDSVVGPETFVGEFTELKHSLACGSTLINWKNGSCVQVRDAFLLSSLRQRRVNTKSAGWPARLAAMAAILVTWPVALLALLFSRLDSEPVLRARAAVAPPSPGAPEETVVYYELAHSNRWLRRWPQLWNVACGTFSWVGNRPLTREEADSLANDFERLWLSAPIGLVSLADAEGCDDLLGDEGRAHASFYAVQAHTRLDWSILRRAVLPKAIKARQARERPLLPEIKGILKGIET